MRGSLSLVVAGPNKDVAENHSDLKATHTFGNDAVVRPATRTVNVPNAFQYTFPKHSLTILRLSVK